VQEIEHRFNAMGGPCRLRLHCVPTLGTELIAAAEAELARLETRYSRYRADSLVSRINAAAGSGKAIAIDAETAGLLHYADTLWQQSDGLFDLTSGILRRAWDFRSSRVPSRADIDALLPLIGWDQVEWSKQAISLPRPGMELDFGGLVKEYACDSVANRLRALGLEHGLVDLAGDMVALGCQGDGSPWQIGIRHPEARERAIAHIPLADHALASSGDYERCLTVGGQRLSHILNPKTGWPVSGLIGVSVVASQCLVAGSSATIAMLSGEAEGLAWLESLGLPWLAIDRSLQLHGSIACKD
jgi:thiamine biosynthesis lipoprotein